MRVAVIGLGYVGLPLAIRLSQLDFNVLGIDINSKKIEDLQKGVLPFANDEPFLKDYFNKEHKRNKITFSTNFENISDKDLIFINVDTPIIGKVPNYSSLISAIKSIAPKLKKKSIVIIESTVSPNTSKNFLIPTIEKYSKLKINKDFFLATVPERIRPNYIFKQLTSLSRVIGVSDKKIKPSLKRVYSQITSGEIDFTDLTTAETVKTVENSFRDVNIAFANEVAIACEEIGVNVWEVMELVNKSPLHNMHQPGAGVGGHCIPKDPWLLASSIKKQNMKLIDTSRSINDNMPKHIFKLTKEALSNSGLRIKNTKLAILGYSYVENSDDTRNSPTSIFEKILKKEKIKFEIHDPLVKEYSKRSVEDIIKGSNCLVLMVSHGAYKYLDVRKISRLMSTKIIIDGRNFFDKEKVTKAGFIYKGVGNV